MVCGCERPNLPFLTRIFAKLLVECVDPLERIIDFGAHRVGPPDEGLGFAASRGDVSRQYFDEEACWTLLSMSTRIKAAAEERRDNPQETKVMWRGAPWRLI